MWYVYPDINYGGCRPAPVLGSTKELGFLGTVLHVELPRDLEEQQLGNGPHMKAVTDQDCHVCSDYSFYLSSLS